MVIPAPDRELQLRIDINFGIVRVDPACFLLGSDLLQHDVVRGEETDSEIILLLRINWG